MCRPHNSTTSEEGLKVPLTLWWDTCSI